MNHWPVFLDRTMHKDSRVQFEVGQVMSWNVILIDAGAAGWPEDASVLTDVRIDPRPDFATRGSLARTPHFAACWRGAEPVGSAFSLRAALSVDSFNPPFWSTVTGAVTAIDIVGQELAQGEDGVWNPVGPWSLEPVQRTPGLSHPWPYAAGLAWQSGFLIRLDIRSLEIVPFPPRA